MDSQPAADAEAPKHRPQHTRTVARNSFWYSVDTGFGFFLALCSSIPIARVIGPARLGYYAYVLYLCRIGGAVGTFGIALTVRKYMSEYLGKGQPGLARSIYSYSLRLQTTIAILIVSAGLAVVYLLAPHDQRWMSALLVLSILPNLMVGVPSQANLALENTRANLISNVAGGILYILAIALSLQCGWGLIGVAGSMVLYRATDFGVKYVQLHRWGRNYVPEPVDADLRRRMITFSGSGVLLMLLQLVVWDRSDVFFLKLLGPAIDQVSFYSVSISLSDQVAAVPFAFAVGLSASLMVQYGRDRKGMNAMVAESLRYLALLALPLLLGLAALSSSTIHILYGDKYLPAIPVLAVAAVLTIPKALITPATQALLAAEQQVFVVRWTVVCSVANVALDCAWIPAHGAIGAAYANGAAQSILVAAVWIRAVRSFELQMPYRSLMRIAISSLTMLAAVVLATRQLHPWLAAPIGIAVGCTVFFVMLRLTGALVFDDRRRLLQFEAKVPGFLRPLFDDIVGFLTPAS
jgi:O-antigen/teichoic acid export membrane protein